MSEFTSRPLAEVQSAPPMPGQEELVAPQQQAVAQSPLPAQTSTESLVMDVDLDAIAKKEYPHFDFRYGGYLFTLQPESDEVIYEVQRMFNNDFIDYHELFDYFFPATYFSCEDAHGEEVEDGLDILMDLLPGSDRPRAGREEDARTKKDVTIILDKVVVAALSKWSEAMNADSRSSRSQRRRRDRRPRSRV